MSCHAVQVPGTYWDFCPSEAASVLFLVLFLLTTVGHAAQAVLYRKPYCWVIVMSAIWQSLTYIFRTLSIQNPSNFSDYAAWFVLILMAPLWTNAFVYMVFGRMIWHYTADKRLWKLEASRFGLVFVGLDIIAFLVQITGAAVAATSLQQGNALKYLHIYMAGVGIQLLFILIFTACVLSFYLKARQDAARPRGLQSLLFAELTALFLIVVSLVPAVVLYHLHVLPSTLTHSV